MEKAIDFCFRTEGAAGSVAPTIDSNGCTYDLAERYRLMQSICRTRHDRLLCPALHIKAYEEYPRICFFVFLLTQRHLHPADVENRPNGLTINIFIGRQVGTGVHKSD